MWRGRVSIDLTAEDDSAVCVDENGKRTTMKLGNSAGGPVSVPVEEANPPLVPVAQATSASVPVVQAWPVPPRVVPAVRNALPGCTIMELQKQLVALKMDLSNKSKELTARVEKFSEELESIETKRNASDVLLSFKRPRA